MFLILIFDVFIGAVVWPFIKRRISKEHAHEKKLEARVWMLEHPLQEMDDHPVNCRRCTPQGNAITGGAPAVRDDFDRKQGIGNF